MSDRPRPYRSDPRDLVVRCYLRLPGDPPPDLSAFSNPIVVPCRIVRRNPLPDPVQDTLAAGRPAPSSVPFEPAIIQRTASAPDGSLRLMTAAGTTLAVGDAAHLSRLAWNVFARLPKGHPVLLVAAGATLAFATAAALAEHLVAMAGDRNADLPTPLRACSRRARARIGADGKAASEHLNDDEWRAHHLIGVDSARNFPELLADAAQAGWRMDSESNVMLLPRTRAAQAKLAAADIRLPLHDNAHLKWNAELRSELLLIEDGLHESTFPKGSPKYNETVRTASEALQARLRDKALKLDRITFLERFSVS